MKLLLILLAWRMMSSFRSTRLMKNLMIQIWNIKSKNSWIMNQMAAPQRATLKRRRLEFKMTMTRTVTRMIWS